MPVDRVMIVLPDFTLGFKSTLEVLKIYHIKLRIMAAVRQSTACVSIQAVATRKSSSLHHTKRQVLVVKWLENASKMQSLIATSTVSHPLAVYWRKEHAYLGVSSSFILTALNLSQPLKRRTCILSISFRAKNEVHRERVAGDRLQGVRLWRWLRARCRK